MSYEQNSLEVPSIFQPTNCCVLERSSHFLDGSGLTGSVTKTTEMPMRASSESNWRCGDTSLVWTLPSVKTVRLSPSTRDSFHACRISGGAPNVLMLGISSGTCRLIRECEGR